jgi:hypothetical protein
MPQGRRDAKRLREGRHRAGAHHDLREVSADKAYASVEHHEVLESINVEACIPFKGERGMSSRSLAWSRHLCELWFHEEKFLTRRRSDVETAFAMIRPRSAHPVAPWLLVSAVASSLTSK